MHGKLSDQFCLRGLLLSPAFRCKKSYDPTLLWFKIYGHRLVKEGNTLGIITPIAQWRPKHKDAHGPCHRTMEIPTHRGFGVEWALN